MANISLQGLLASIVPRPYFKRITLESGASTYKWLKKENPHIDPAYITVPAPGVSMGWAGGWSEGKSAPEGFGESEPDPTEQLIVTVDIVLKETVNPQDPAYGWFQEEGFKYLNIGILQVTNAADIQTLSNFAASSVETSSTIKAYFANSLTQSPSETQASQLVLLREALDLKTPIQTLEASREVVQLSELQETGEYNIFKDMDNFENQFISHVHSDGTISYDIPIQVTFIVPNTSYPGNLAYFVATSFDSAMLLESELFNDFPMPSPSDGPSTPPLQQEGFYATTFFEFNSEIVIRNNSVVTHGTVFKIAQSNFEETYGNLGDIWAGPVHYNPNLGWMAGKETTLSGVTLTPSQPQLVAESVSNSTVQDFRKIKEIEKVNIDLSKLKASEFSGFSKIKILSNDKTPIELSEQNISYFSDAWISRGISSKDHPPSTFMFAIDFLSLLKDNIIFPKMLENPSDWTIQEQIKKYCTIQSMKILRRRVKNREADRLGLETNLVAYDKNELEEVIKFVKEPSEEFSSLEIPSSELYADQPGIRYFAFTDTDVETKEFGLYQYGIELTVKDGSLEYLKNDVLQPLSEGIQTFETYYSLGSMKGNYNNITNKFTNKFAAELGYLIHPQIQEQAWDKISAVFSFIVGKNINDIKQLVLPVQNATLRGVSAFIDMAKNIETQLTNIINSVGQGNLFKLSKQESDLYNVSPTPASSNVRRNFTIKYFLDGTFDADLDLNVGYNYINPGQYGKYGLPQISSNDYKQKTSDEVSKYFFAGSDLGPNGELPALGAPGGTAYKQDSTEISRYAYLTPNLVCMPHWAPDHKYVKNYPAKGEPFDSATNEYNTEILTDILKYNVGKSRHGAEYSSAPTGRRFDMLQLLEEKNCTFYWEPEVQADYGFKSPLAQYVFSDMVNKKLAGIEPFFATYAVKELGLLTDQMKLTSYKLSNLVQAVYFETSPYTVLFPNHLKALTYTGSNLKYTDWFQVQEIPEDSGKFFNTGLTWENMASFILKHMTIAQVKVFSGFQIDDHIENGIESPTYGRPMMKSPMWVPLDSDIFKSGIQGGMLCKLVPYSAEFVGNAGVSFEYRPIKSLQLPIYNEHFVIQFD